MPAGSVSDPAEAVLFALRIGLAAVLYGFLGLALWVLIREQRASQPVSPLARLFQLDEQSSVVRQYDFRESVWIGRDPNCPVQINDEFASARHARLEWDCSARTWWLEDGGSRNGTWINDDRVTRRALADGDVIRVGNTRYRFDSCL